MHGDLRGRELRDLLPGARPGVIHRDLHRLLRVRVLLLLVGVDLDGGERLDARRRARLLGLVAVDGGHLDDPVQALGHLLVLGRERLAVATPRGVELHQPDVAVREDLLLERLVVHRYDVVLGLVHGRPQLEHRREGEEPGQPRAARHPGTSLWCPLDWSGGGCWGSGEVRGEVSGRNMVVVVVEVPNPPLASTPEPPSPTQAPRPLVIEGRGDEVSQAGRGCRGSQPERAVHCGLVRGDLHRLLPGRGEQLQERAEGS
mmetsp:Transcript_25675/g.81539  ORF Transcript_25675/g.81539 Transcript_25675/m.81539 type:complete len:259 (-) Transcript_25675:1063-1839(-)